MKPDYLKTEFKEFFNSFKLKFNFLQIALFDLIFYAAIFLTSIFSTKIIEAKGAGVDTSMLTEKAMTAASEAELAVFYSGFKGFIITAVLIVIAVILITLLGWSLTRGLIYTNLLKKKFTKEYFMKFTGLNIVLAAIVFVIMIFASILVQLQVLWLIYLAALILFSIGYFMSLIYIKFTKKLKVFESIGDGITFGVKKIHKMLLPGILILSIGLIINYLLSFAPESIFLLIIIFAAYMAWARIYFVSAVKRA